MPIRTKSDFMRFGTVTFGALAALGGLWMFGRYGRMGWWVFLIALAFGAGWVWSFFMWQVFRSEIESRNLRSSANGTKKSAPVTPQNDDA